MRLFFVFVLGLFSQQLLTQITIDFSSNITEGCEVAVVNFEDLSSSNNGFIVSWKWDLSIANSDEQNPGLIYNNVGSYTICLEVEDNLGNSEELCKQDYIKVHPNPEAAIDLNTYEGCSPLQVFFSDVSISSAPINEWIWDIGGSTGVIISSDSTEIIFSNYSNPGNYGVSLNITNENGCSDILSVSDLIEVVERPNLEYQIIDDNNCSFPKSYDLFIEDPQIGVDYTWVLEGIQSFFGSQIDDIQIDTATTIDITLIATNTFCSDTLLIADAIDTRSKFSIQPTSEQACLGDQISFEIDGLFPIDSVHWDFGDGNSSTDISPSHGFTSEDCYTISAQVFTENCVDTIIFDCIEIGSSLSFLNVDVNLESPCQFPTTMKLNSLMTVDGTYQWSVKGNGIDTILSGANTEVELEQYGTYQITVDFTGQNGCVINSVLDPVILEKFMLELSEVGPSGCIPLEVDLGNLILNDGQFANYEWNIQNGLFESNSSSPAFTFLDTGKYDLKLIVTNELGCVDTVMTSNYFRAGIPPIVDFVGFPQEDCASIRDSFFDLSSNYADQWLWDFGDGATSFDQNPTHLYKDSLFYTVSLTAWHNGCSSQEIKPNYIHPIAPISKFNVSYNCDNPYQVGVKSNSIGADSLAWYIKYDTHIDTIINMDSINVIFPNREDYKITLYTANFTSGCDYELKKTIKIRDPEAKFSLDTIRGCAPYTIKFEDLSIDAKTYMYDFSNTLNDQTISNPSSMMEEAGSYAPPSLTITSIYGCEDFFVFEDSIYVNRVFADAEFRDNVCLPDTVSFNDKSQSLFATPNKWNWKMGVHQSGEQNSFFVLNSDDDFDLFFEVSDDWNCKDTLIKENAIDFAEPSVDFFADTLSCTWNEIKFTNQSSDDLIDTYYWDFGDGQNSTDKNPQHLYTSEGVYTVCLTIESTTGCDKRICKDDYIIISNPSASFDSDNNYIICPPLLTEFTNNSINSLEFQWDFGDDSGFSNLHNPSHLFTNPGTYDIELVASLNEFCQDTLRIEDFIVVDGPIGSFEMEKSNSCAPLSIELYAEANGQYEFIWDFDNGVLQETDGFIDKDTIFFTYETPGVFTPRMILMDSSGCTISYSGEDLNVDQIDLNFVIEDTLVCFNESAEIEIENLSTSSANQVDYYWSVLQDTEINSEEFSPTFVIDSIGQVDILLIGDTGNCRDSILKTSAIEFIQKVSVEAIGDSICYGESAKLSTTGNASEWFWKKAGLGFAENKSAIVQNPTETTMYEVVGLREGCESDTAYANVLVYDQIIVELEEVYQAYANLDIQLEIEFNESKNYLFEWSPPDFLSCTDCPDPWITELDMPMQYIVNVIDAESGCLIEKKVLVRYENDCSKKAFYLPNVFTPNNDGRNDGFRIFAQDEREFIELYIFDRWGEEMFYTDDIELEWNAIFKNEDLQPGVYAVSIRALCLSSNEEYRINHTVTIVR